MANKLKINLQQMLKKQFDPSRSKALENLAFGTATRKVKTAQQMLLQELNKHEVTQSLEKGTKVSSLGFAANLFEYLGFNQGQNPVSVVRDSFANFVHLKRAPIKKKINYNKVNYDFLESYPSLTELYSVTPLPWGGGRSWIRAVEKGGVSNFNYTLSKESGYSTSRSGTAIQSENEVRAYNYKPVPYVSPMLAKFRATLSV